MRRSSRAATDWCRQPHHPNAERVKTFTLIHTEQQAGAEALKRSRGRRSVAARDAGPWLWMRWRALRPPPALPARRLRLRNASAREAPGADRLHPPLTRQKSSMPAVAPGSPAQPGRPGTPAAATEEQLGIRLRIAPAVGEVRSMRGIRMRFEEQPALPKTRR